MKIISFSLWGNNVKYCIGAIKNAELTSIIYPNWISRFYIHKDVDQKYIDQIKNLNAQVFIMEENPDWKAMMWRYLPAKDKDVQLFISRDCDSRINNREKSAVDQWLTSDKNFHIMRDHPYHGFSILGGMFGAKKNGFEILTNSIAEFNFQNSYGTDYNFFNSNLYPKIKQDSLVHDEFFDKKPFPTMRLNNQFVGEIFDENDNPDATGKQALTQYLNK
jgi:protein O-GlcNAc transferase